jgi:hypothetical protein
MAVRGFAIGQASEVNCRERNRPVIVERASQLNAVLVGLKVGGE